MTLIICLNYGDKIFVASDSLMTTRESNGQLHPEGYRLKLYPVGHCNAVVAFSGGMEIASRALKSVGQYAFENRPTETALFEALPAIITHTVKQAPQDKVQDFDILFAGLTPNSRAYDQEVYPGIGVPPITACGVFSWKPENENHLTIQVGKAKHVPSSTGMKFLAANPQALMDLFVTGSGAKEVIPSFRYYQYYYELRHQPDQFLMMMTGTLLSEFFSEIPIEISGVGGEYQVALITENGIQYRISKANEPDRPVSIKFNHGTYVVTDLLTGRSDFIQSIWDERYPFEIKEMGYLL